MPFNGNYIYIDATSNIISKQQLTITIMTTTKPCLYQGLILVGASQPTEVLLVSQALEVAAADQ